MSSRNSKGRRQGQGQREAGRSPALLIGLLLVTVAIIATTYLLMGEPAEGDFLSTAPAPSTVTPAATPPPTNPEPPATSPSREGPVREAFLPEASAALENLVGRWLRPDGGYILEIRGFDRDGNLETAYFNPRPIHVSQARANGSPEDLQIFVELTDVGYPGATYDLRYIAEQDVLAGFYFQPALGQRFDVFFIRRE